MLIALISDSQRHLYLSNQLTDSGYDTNVYRTVDEIPSEIKADIIVLPIPTKDKDGFLNIKGSFKMTVENLISRTNSNSYVITCNYECNDRKFTDINKYEKFTSLNAIPSAEGAVFEAMKNSNIPLYGAKSLVVGYGRIGKIIAHRMHSFCSATTVVARNPKDRYAATALGLKAIDFSELLEEIATYDFIFQTVPHLVLTEKHLALTKATIIELSSKCAGTDYEFAKKNGNNLLYCPALPEKYSKDYASKVFADSVKSILEKI